jgi:hypothetical protein
MLLQTSETVTGDAPALDVSDRVFESAFEPQSAPKVEPKEATRPNDEISREDEKLLTSFFSSSGQNERSTYGAIVEHLQYLAFDSNDCARCEGSGILENGGFRIDNTCRHCNGDGLARTATGAETPIGEYLHAEACRYCKGTCKEASYEVELKHGGWCPSCRGTGASGIDRRGAKPSACSKCPGKRTAKKCNNCGVCQRCADVRACRACGNCLGTGVEPVTVHRTGEEGATGGSGGSDGPQSRHSVMSRRLQRVHLQSAAAFRALATYYGDEGEHWATNSEKERGRIFALYAGTEAGKELVKIVRRERAKPWKNPNPRPAQEPEDLEALWGVIDECVAFEKRRARKVRRPPHLRDFMGPIQEGVGWLDSGRASEHEIELPKGEDGFAKHMTHSEVIARVGDEERNHSSVRRQLFLQAGKQARQLYSHAAAVWNASKQKRNHELLALAKVADRHGHKPLANRFVEAGQVTK